MSNKIANQKESTMNLDCPQSTQNTQRMRLVNTETNFSKF